MITLIISAMVIFIGLGRMNFVTSHRTFDFDWGVAPNYNAPAIPPMPDYAPTNHTSNEEDDIWCDAYDEAEAAFDTLFSQLEYARAGEYAIMRRVGQSKFIYCKKI